MAVLNRLHLSTLLFGLAMELGAVYPIVLYFTPTQVGVWGVLLYLLLGVVAGWVVYAEVEQIGRVRLLLTGIGAVAAVLIPLAFHWTLWGGALLLCVAYWRGVMLSQYSEHPRWVSSAVMELVAMMLGTLLLPVFSQQPMFDAAAAPYYLLFFAGGLATMASARADLLRRRWEGGMGRR
ncbi:MAG: hypothetical protein ACM3XM_09500, partial [Mycobacterium leprae]